VVAVLWCGNRGNKAMHAEHAIGRFLHGGFTRACRVMAVVIPL